MPDSVDVCELEENELRRLALALLDRSVEARYEDGYAAFRQRWPQAPERMLRQATFHVYGGSPKAVLRWLASAELFLQNPQHEWSSGDIWEVLVHIYSWLQIESLIPETKASTLMRLDEIETLIDNDPEAAKGAIAWLRENLEGNFEAPRIDSGH